MLAYCGPSQASLGLLDRDASHRFLRPTTTQAERSNWASAALTMTLVGGVRCWMTNATSNTCLMGSLGASLIPAVFSITVCRNYGPLNYVTLNVTPQHLVSPRLEHFNPILPSGIF